MSSEMSEAVEIIHDPRSVMLLPSNDKRRIEFEAQVAEKLRADREAHAARLAAEPKIEPRAALRAAIQKHADLAHRLTELTKAVPKAESAIFAARSGVEQATAALEDAKREASSHHAAAAMGTASGAAPSITKARRVLEAAQDELEAAKAASADLQKQHAATKQSVGIAEMQRNDALAAVIRSDPATQKLSEVPAHTGGLAKEFARVNTNHRHDLPGGSARRRRSTSI